MSYPEQLVKFDPPRSVALSGVDNYGAFASVTNATATGFQCQGVFRDFSDFAVVALQINENGVYEHPLMRALPDFDYSGLTLSFDLTTNGVWPIDARYYPTTNAQRMGVITHDPATGAEQNIICSFWENAVLKSGAFTAASCTFTVTHNPDIDDQIILFVGNVAFNYTGNGSDTATDVASSLTYQVNNYDWSAFAQSSVSVLATWNGANGVTLTYARTGKVTVSGNTVHWQQNGTLPSELFVGLSSGDPFIIAGNRYIIASLLDQKTLTLTGSPGIGAGPFTYIAPFGGEDGNGLTCYIVPDPINTGIGLSATTLPLSGGVSDGLTWTITLNFGALTGVLPAYVANPNSTAATRISAGHFRECWTTIAPKINHAAQYADTEWSVIFSNWTVAGTGRNLYVAGPGSQRVGSLSSWVTYNGAWSQDTANIHYQGFAMVSSTPGDSISVKIICQDAFDLYLGTEFYVDRQKVSVSMDGDAATIADTYQNNAAPAYGRVLLRSGVAAGTHIVTITLNGTHNASATPAGGLYSFLFDFLEAAVPGLVQAPSVTYNNCTAALDLDTYPYSMSGARLVWQLQTLGFLGKANLDLGVFWLYNRVRVGGSFSFATITFSGSWSNGDAAYVNISGFVIGKSCVQGDTNTTIAAHFVDYINSASVAFWASSAGGVLTITQRSTGSEFAATVTTSKTSSGGSVSPASQSVGVGTEGVWTIDDSASPLLNVGVRAWLADFYGALAAAGMQCVSAVTMELVNPQTGYSAQFADGSDVTTATGFGVLKSTQSRVAGSLVVALQIETFNEVAALMIAAGLVPWLQFGEQQFWYFPRYQSVSIAAIQGTGPLTIAAAASSQVVGYVYAITGTTTYIGVANPFSSSVSVGDTIGISISGVLGDTAINGIWEGVVGPDTSHITIPVASNGSWTVGSGTLTVLAKHALPNGSTATVVGVNGATNANGTWTVTVPNPYWFTIPATLNAPWSGGGNFSGGSMAVYDPETSAAALASLGRPLAQFYCQDDDPTLNPADVAFLQNRLFMNHYQAIMAGVKAVHPTVKFELLYPCDVNHSPMVWNQSWPYAQGGRLNRALSWPSQLQTKATSGFDSLLIEALSWGASYRSLDLAKAAMAWPITAPNSWVFADISYLFPVFNGGCPWESEYLAAVNSGYLRTAAWAMDQIASQGLSVSPMPVNPSSVSSS